MLYCVLYCLPSVAALIAAVYLFAGKRKSEIRVKMAWVFLMLSIAVFCYAQYFNPKLIESESWGFDLVYTLIAPFCAPAYYVFLARLTDVRKNTGREVLAFLPSAIFVILSMSAFLFATAADKHAYFSHMVQGQVIQTELTKAFNWLVTVDYDIFRILIPLQAVAAIILGEFRLKSYVSLLGDYYSSLDNRGVIHIRGIHTLSIVVLILSLLLAMIPLYESNGVIWLVVPVILLEIFLVVMIVHYLNKIDYSAETLRELLGPVQQNVQSPGENYIPILIEKMDKLMERDQLYKNPALSLMMLAEQVGTNRTYVSQAIKVGKGCNFSDYVNSYRIKYALELMSSTPKNEIMIQNIAYECGCGSTQTFYRYFKQFYGKTPTVWLEENA